MSFLTPLNIALALIAVNFIAFAVFGIDKVLAEQGMWRIAEGTLLFWAMVGGTPGAFAGRALFRHKTRKQPFSQALWGIAVVQLFGLTFWLVYRWPAG